MLCTQTVGFTLDPPQTDGKLRRNLLSFANHLQVTFELNILVACSFWNGSTALEHVFLLLGVQRAAPADPGDGWCHPSGFSSESIFNFR